MKLLRPAGVLAAACLLAGLSAAQDEEIPKIRGRVVGGIGAPIAGAVVHGPGGTVKTDSSGVFSIPGNPASEDQMLLVKADGFALFHRDLLPDSHESEILVRLGPPMVAVVKVVGEDGRPVRNATVHGRIPFAPAYSALERADFDAVTDQEGYAVIRDIPADMVVVAELRPAGMIPAQSAPLAPVPEGSPDELARRGRDGDGDARAEPPARRRERGREARSRAPRSSSFRSSSRGSTSAATPRARARAARSGRR